MSSLNSRGSNNQWTAGSNRGVSSVGGVGGVVTGTGHIQLVRAKNHIFGPDPHQWPRKSSTVGTDATNCMSQINLHALTHRLIEFNQPELIVSFLSLSLSFSLSLSISLFLFFLIFKEMELNVFIGCLFIYFLNMLIM